MRRGIELGFFNGRPLVYDGTEPVAIDAQASKGKLARFLGVNLVSPRTAHLTKIITDPKDAERRAHQADAKRAHLKSNVQL
jgi:type IV secretion system protein VirD4